MTAYDQDQIVEPNTIYQHFKGRLYRVIGGALDAESEDLTPRVIYRPIEGGPTYSRTKANFLEVVDRPDFNYSGPRFRFLRVG